MGSEAERALLRLPLEASNDPGGDSEKKRGGQPAYQKPESPEFGVGESWVPVIKGSDVFERALKLPVLDFVVVRIR
jgi:hypothetical protein